MKHSRETNCGKININHEYEINFAIFILTKPSRKILSTANYLLLPYLLLFIVRLIQRSFPCTLFKFVIFVENLLIQLP